MLPRCSRWIAAWVCVPLLLDTVAGVDEIRFRRVIEHMEDSVLGIKAEIERLYASRCSQDTLRDCERNVYDHCTSTLGDTSCQVGHVVSNPICDRGNCGTLYSYEHSTTVLPLSLQTGVDGNPTDPGVIESICSTQELDTFFVDMYESNRELWGEFGVDPPWMHYGTQNGAYRIFPGQQTADCFFFDPRNRPWYIAASTGPKNIVLLLDVSGSMDTGNRLGLMKRAAKRVVDTLSVGDRVAIIPFSREPSIVADVGSEGKPILFKATNTNKAVLNEEIDKLEADGSTNFLDTFNATFELLENSLEVERLVGCNTAILFLTDGEMTTPEGVQRSTVIDLVNNGIGRVKERLGHSVILFTYSISDDERVHDFPKQLACSTGDGIWSVIFDEDEILESLKSYSDLFSLGLGSGINEKFTTFVEPYDFFDVEGALGVTVSAPVFDTSKTPHLFLGVAGVDVLVAALDRALDVPIGSTRTLELLEERSTAKCPSIAELTLCERESVRRRGISRPNNDALCTTSCTADDFVEVEEQDCPGVSYVPSYLWENNLGLSKSVEERLCCCALEDALGPTADKKTSGSGQRIRVFWITFGSVCAAGMLLTMGALIAKRSSGAESISPLPPPILPPRPSAPGRETSRMP